MVSLVSISIGISIIRISSSSSDQQRQQRPATTSNGSSAQLEVAHERRYRVVPAWDEVEINSACLPIPESGGHVGLHAGPLPTNRRYRTSISQTVGDFSSPVPDSITLPQTGSSGAVMTIDG